MASLRSSIVPAAVFFCLLSCAWSDTLTLKNGEHLEGKVTKETDKDVTIEVRISAGIIDERVISKADIEKVSKTSPELEAYKAVEGIHLQQNSLTSAQYEPYITALQTFLQQFPNSTRAADVQKVLASVEEEQKRVDSGEAKLDGRWLSKAEVEREKVQIGGRQAFAYMKSQSASGDYVGALNAFAALEKTYPGASVMPDAIELARKLIPALQTELERAIPEQKALQAERDKGMKAAGSAQKAQIKEAAKQEDGAGDAAAAAAEAGNRWAPFMKTNAKCLAQLRGRAIKELPRLAALKPDQMRQSIQDAELARQDIASGSMEAANTALKESLQLWKDNELAIRLTKEATERKAAPAPEPPPATPAPVAPVPAKTKLKQPVPPTATSVPNIPAAGAATPALTVKAGAAGATLADASTAVAAAPSTGTPAPDAKKAATPVPAAPKAAPATPAPEARPSAAAKAEAAANPADEEERPFFLRLPVAIGIVVGLTAVLAVANIFLKMKQRKAEQAELVHDQPPSPHQPPH